MTTNTANGSSTKGMAKKKGNVFHRRLGSLTYFQACQLLGDEGANLIRDGGRLFEIESDDHVYLGGDLYRVRIEDPEVDGGIAIASITLQSARSKQLQTNCDCCEVPCVHLGAAIDHLLNAKTDLGLAQPPDESVPLENLTRDELNERALSDRMKRAEEEKMKVRSTNTGCPWTDYVVTSVQSGRTYRVALRSFETGESYCSCPDFRGNRLRTCKHILHVQAKVKQRFNPSKLGKPYRRKKLSLRIDYGNERGLLFNMPHKSDPRIEEIVGNGSVVPMIDAEDVMTRIAALDQAGFDVTIYPDAEDFIQRQLVQKRVAEACQEIRKDPATHPLRTELLDAELLPYQLDGIAFAVGAGRAILADDMGLGKTIQGIGVAELLNRLAEIRRVLVICPASLKSQWRSEISRFSGRDSQIVLGRGADRAEQYRSDKFFTICNYEQILRDLSAVEAVPWDLIILDEGQRIKNWESKTSNVVRQLDSPFRLVLSGTPLENRLGDLFTVTRFVDETRLGPAYEFFHRHHVVDERGKTLGYQRLDELRERLSPILLRRTRSEVAKQLPQRTDEIIRCSPTAEQMEIHDSHMAIVAQIVHKRFMTEMDLLRMQKSLLMARMACDSTYLIDQEEPEYSSKLERLSELLDGLIDDPSRKIIVFSEWRRMLDRIERKLSNLGADFVRLDGQVPQKKRGALVDRFQTDPECRVILMTNAGSTGLNLQAANTVINVDLPWNPAVLEQRIARAYRMGQENPVHVYKMVTSGDSIEEKLLNTLASKQELANASIDYNSDVTEVAMTSGMEDLKRRLEVILDPLPPAELDQSQQRRVEAETQRLVEQREKVSAASGQLITAALSLAGELMSGPDTNPPAEESVVKLTERLSQCVERDEQGRPKLTISLADDTALRGLATTLAKLLDS
ncbi:RNA polymerase-associated protein RapA [Novipirellula aureliae]|uniref:RNA polymerase-associated protein RapA n=1 Tax=Novipirellula aureliae TaxID=2527966 RepID=A0A5C6DQC2_9BACT|nr:DEAD/DEAH box helicase [Novipirellula aureliae]TWU37841.1 RNA polymerase-associated protein RapA [Novipirellula aureliae]